MRAGKGEILSADFEALLFERLARSARRSKSPTNRREFNSRVGATFWSYSER